jgi:hypothetical protein
VTSEQVDLVEAYLDNTIPATGVKRLLELLAADPGFKKEFAEALRLGGLLEAVIGPDASCDRLADVVGIAIPSGSRALDSKVMAMIQERGVQAPHSARRRGFWTRRAVLALGAAAALALVTFGVWAYLRGTSPAQIVAAGGSLEVERGSDRVGVQPPYPIRDGETIHVPSGGWAWIRYLDGTTLQLGSETSVTLGGEGSGSGSKRARVKRGVLFAEVRPQPPGHPMVLASPHSETKVLGTSFSLAVGKDSTKLIVRSGKVAFTKREGEGAIEVTSGHVATAAKGLTLASEPIRREFLRKLGKDHFLLGIMSGWAESWVSETREQGCRWDLRYQHLGANWTQWNAGGAFVPMYLQESQRLGIVPVFTYYGMIRSTPVNQEPGELAAQIVKNCDTTSTMRRYFTDLKLFMQKAGDAGTPVILHVEPGVWAQFLSAPEFRPNRLEEIHVVVRSSGVPELAGLDDTAASFGKAFGVLRDRYAPNVLLAWHASKVDGLSPSAVADGLLRCGVWDLLFTDVGDRDAGFNEARGVANAWWKDEDFTRFREWGAEVYALTGLPLMVWRIPLGNTHMATCNNTPWHYMDNRVEYWLEGYPANRHLAEWADAGFIGLLFGGGSVECTVHRDNAKDGITNPPPVAGNKGEKSAFADDDGGYLRLRAGNYYRSGPLKYSGN